MTVKDRAGSVNAIDQLESLYSRLIELNITLDNCLTSVVYAVEAAVDLAPVDDSTRITRLLDLAHQEVSQAERLLSRVVL